MSGSDSPADENQPVVNTTVAESAQDIPETDEDRTASSESHDKNATATALTDLKSWRLNVISGFVFLGWIILLARLVQLQGAQRQLMNDRVARQSIFSEVIPARPGEILDRNGHVLAMTITCDSLYVVPDEISEPWDFAWKAGSILNVNADELYQRLIDNKDKQFLWIKRRTDDATVQEFRKLGLPKSTWGLRREYQRKYPQGRFASHVLGIRNIDNEGKGGLEQSLNALIRGVDGNRVMTRDARGIVVEVAADQSSSPDHGQTVVSTIDLLMQIETERCLDELMDDWKPVGACAIVMEPHSGDVLAMASRPSFDPNSLVEVPEAAWKNLAVSAAFEPGSTFKPFIVGWALQEQLLRSDEMIDCSYGAYRMGPRILHDHHSYGELSVEDVLVKSSNIGMAKIGERLGLEALYEATRSFGFGRRTGIELPGEIPGLLHSFDRWNVYSLGSIPMGQELAVTPLQLITAHAALANGGRLVRPRLIRGASEDDSIASPASAVNAVRPAADVGARLLDPQVTRWLVEQPMKQVVERGTGKTAKIPGLSIFGKTGTAQKLDPETGTYSDKAWVLSFICGAPAEDPSVIVLLMVDEPTVPGVHYGGTVAAPTASKILQFAEARARTLDLHQPRMTQKDSPDSGLR